MAKEFIAFVFTTKSTTTTARRTTTAAKHRATTTTTPMAVHLTMEDAVEQAREEIWLYHTMHGFAAMLTHHSSREAPRQLSHEGDYDDRGHFKGTYALMFKCEDEDSIPRIFDQANERHLFGCFSRVV